MHKLSLWLALTGATAIVLAVALGFFLFPNIVDNNIKRELRLVRGSNVWNRWTHIETPVYLNVYVFNVTNPDEVEAGGAPKLQEVGPYSYKERREKIDPRSDNCKETVKYEQKITYYFDQTKSGMRMEEDIVNVINVPFLSLVTVISKEVQSFLPIIADELPTEPLIRRNISVGDLIFNGFNVSSLNTPTLGDLLPPSFSGLRFGLYKGRNGTTDGLFEVYTGAEKNKEDMFGTIKTWKGSSNLPYWNSSTCNKITGTDGSIFRPFLEKKDSIKFFTTELCRVTELKFKQEVTFKDLKGYRFAVPKEVFEGPEKNPDNACYCLKEDKEECRDGIIDLGVCRNGAPIVMSAPHFLDGYEGYATAMGLNPKRKLHETVIDIEPRSGILLRAHKRLQVNLELKNIEDIPQLQHIQGQVLFPVIWVDEEASICDVDVDDFKSRVVTPINTVSIITWTAIGIGCVLLVLAFAAPKVCSNRGKSGKLSF